MTDRKDGPSESRESNVTSIDALRRTRDTDRRLVHQVLEHATQGADAQIDGLLDAVPRMLEEARRRRGRAGRRDVLTASIPVARKAVPRLAAVAALLVVISTALLLVPREVGTVSTSDFDEVLIAGNGITDEMMVESILGPEEQP